MDLEKLTFAERLNLAIKIIFYKKEENKENEWTDLEKKIFINLTGTQPKSNLCWMCKKRESRWSNGKCNSCDDAAFGY